MAKMPDAEEPKKRPSASRPSKVRIDKVELVPIPSRLRPMVRRLAKALDRRHASATNTLDAKLADLRGKLSTGVQKNTLAGFVGKKRKRVLLPDYATFLKKPPVGSVMEDLDEIRGETATPRKFLLGPAKDKIKFRNNLTKPSS